MQRTSGLQFTIAVVAGLIQVSVSLQNCNRYKHVCTKIIVETTNWKKLAQLVYLRQRRGRNTSAEDFKRLPHPIEEGNGDRLIEEPYHDDEDEDGEEGAEEDRSTPQPTLPPAGDRAPHRVEPSGLGHDEANEWRSRD